MGNDKIITLNGVKLAPISNKKLLVDSLFKAGGTVSGFYALTKRKIKIYNAQGEQTEVVNRFGVPIGYDIKTKNVYTSLETPVLGEVKSMLKFHHEIKTIAYDYAIDHQNDYVYQYKGG
jgi:hypothetical protein